MTSTDLVSPPPWCNLGGLPYPHPSLELPEFLFMSNFQALDGHTRPLHLRNHINLSYLQGTKARVTHHNCPLRATSK